MPRRPRIHIAGMPSHIVQRGHNREPCFFNEGDIHAYRRWLGEALEETGCALHAYVLMTNHVHLLLTPPAPEAIPRLVICLGRRYVQYINKTYRRTGTLWDSRYKSSLVGEKGPGSEKRGQARIIAPRRQPEDWGQMGAGPAKSEPGPSSLGPSSLGPSSLHGGGELVD